LSLAWISIIAGIGAIVFAVILLAQAPPAATDTTDEALRAPTTIRPAAVTLDGRALGPPEASVVVELWEDFQCPACSRFTRVVEPSLVERFVPTGDVRVIFKDFAFLGPESIDAAVAARCSDEQGAFWPYHDWLYANQNGENHGWYSKTRLAAIATRLGLDRSAFDACVVRPDVQQDVAAETAAGRARGIASTPTVTVDGVPFSGSSYEDLLTTIQAALDTAVRIP
jgi:protein-disulfide isomerase